LLTIGRNAVPQHIWVSRRWLSQLIPAMAILSVLASAKVVAWLARRKIPPTVTAFGLAAAYFLPTAGFLRPFAFRSMLSGLPEAYASVVAKLKASRTTPPLVTTNLQIASILTYLYDVPTALLGGRLEFGLSDAGAREALTCGNFGGMTAIGIEAFELGNTVADPASFAGDYLEMTEGRRPRALITFPLSFDIGVVGGDRSTLEVHAGHPRLVSEVGTLQEGGSVSATGRAGLLLGGPCMPLSPGVYRVDWIGRVLDVGGRRERQGALDAVAEPGANLLASVPLRVSPTGPSEAWIAGLDFSVEKPLACVDFRLRVDSNVAMVITRLRLTRAVVSAPAIRKEGSAIPPTDRARIP
jgi:hypothetical protein